MTFLSTEPAMAGLLLTSAARHTTMTTTQTTTAPTYTATIMLWSKVGHTPITKRAGAYCDELAKTEVEVCSPLEARLAVQDLAAKTPHARSGYYYIADHPNQNVRTGWMNW